MHSTAAQYISEQAPDFRLRTLDSGRQTPGLIHVLGEMPYPQAIKLTENLVKARYDDEIPDTLLFLSHPECISMGTRDGFKHLKVSREFLERRKIQIFKAVRGGNITYHWPGQLVCFPIIKLQRHERDVTKYMWRLEETVIRTLDNLNIRARRRSGLTGVWINDEKISPMGVRITRWVTSHGFAINMSGDITPYSWMNPCGVRDMKLTTLEKQGILITREKLVEILAENFSTSLKLDTMSIKRETFAGLKHAARRKA